jgi:hypothetical protein
MALVKKLSFFEAATWNFFLLHPHENQARFLVQQGLVEILMTTLVSSPKQQLHKHMQYSVEFIL